MKKFFKILGIGVLVILVILIALPFVFKGKIIETVKSEVNKSMNAKIDFSDFGLNFFKSFPNASVSLNDLCVAGIDEFEGDTLAFVKQLSATVNLKSLFGDGGYEISKIIVDNAHIHAIVNAEGKANWDIVPESNAEEIEEDTTKSNFKLALKSLIISNSDIYFDNDSSKMSLAVEKLNLQLSGDMTADETKIKTEFSIDSLSFASDLIPYLSKAQMKGKLDVVADLKNNKFTLADNSLQINAIQAAIDGWLALSEDGGMTMDFKLNAPETDFKDILSLIPAIYSKDFENLKTAGKVSLEAFAKGEMKDELLPAFDVNLSIADAMFQYPGMPRSVTNINTAIHAFSNGGVADSAVVDISKFHFDMGGNPFDLQLHLSTPVSDPNFLLSAVGKLNLGMIKDIYPLENSELSGNLDANLKLASRMSAIQSGKYENVNAQGTLNVKDMLFKSEGSPDIQLNNASLSFSPRYVDLSGLVAQIGKNDIAASGKLENFIPYFLKDETLKGTLAVSSNYLNLNDFMGGDDSVQKSDTASSTAVFEIPKNLAFNLTGNFKQLIFDNLDMTNVVGQIAVADGKVDMKNLSLNALGGKLIVNGSYDTGKNPKQPDVSLALNMQNVSFSQTFSTFVTIQKLAPIFENLKGDFSTTFNLSTPLGEDFMPVLSALVANGALQSNNVEASDISILNGLASALNNESLKSLKIKDLNLPFNIENGRVNTKPFNVNFGGGVMNLTGSTGLDESIDYAAKISLSDKLANSYVKNMNVKIGGTFKKPQFSVDTKALADEALGSIVSSALGGKSGESLSQQVNEELDKQIENIRKQAKDAGDKLVEEAEKQGQKLIDEANKTSNPLAKVAAVKAAESGAKKLKEEAQKKADQLNAEAEKQIENLKK